MFDEWKMFWIVVRHLLVTLAVIVTACMLGALLNISLMTIAKRSGDPGPDTPAADIQREVLTSQDGQTIVRWTDHERRVVCYEGWKSAFACVPCTEEHP